MTLRRGSRAGGALRLACVPAFWRAAAWTHAFECVLCRGATGRREGTGGGGLRMAGGGSRAAERPPGVHVLYIHLTRNILRRTIHTGCGGVGVPHPIAHNRPPRRPRWPFETSSNPVSRTRRPSASWHVRPSRCCRRFRRSRCHHARRSRGLPPPPPLPFTRTVATPEVGGCDHLRMTATVGGANKQYAY